MSDIEEDIYEEDFVEDEEEEEKSPSNRKQEVSGPGDAQSSTTNATAEAASTVSQTNARNMTDKGGAQSSSGQATPSWLDDDENATREGDDDTAKRAAGSAPTTTSSNTQAGDTRSNVEAPQTNASISASSHNKSSQLQNTANADDNPHGGSNDHHWHHDRFENINDLPDSKAGRRAEGDDVEEQPEQKNVVDGDGDDDEASNTARRNTNNNTDALGDMEAAIKQLDAAAAPSNNKQGPSSPNADARAKATPHATFLTSEVEADEGGTPELSASAKRRTAASTPTPKKSSSLSSMGSKKDKQKMTQHDVRSESAPLVMSLAKTSATRSKSKEKKSGAASRKRSDSHVSTTSSMNSARRGSTRSGSKGPTALEQEIAKQHKRNSKIAPIDSNAHFLKPVSSTKNNDPNKKKPLKAMTSVERELLALKPYKDQQVKSNMKVKAEVRKARKDFEEEVQLQKERLERRLKKIVTKHGGHLPHPDDQQLDFLGAGGGVNVAHSQNNNVSATTSTHSSPSKKRSQTSNNHQRDDDGYSDEDFIEDDGVRSDDQSSIHGDGHQDNAVALGASPPDVVDEADIIFAAVSPDKEAIKDDRILGRHAKEQFEFHRQKRLKEQQEFERFKIAGGHKSGGVQKRPFNGRLEPLAPSPSDSSSLNNTTFSTLNTTKEKKKAKEKKVSSGYGALVFVDGAISDFLFGDGSIRKCRLPQKFLTAHGKQGKKAFH